MKRLELIKKTKLVVIKIGTSTITHTDGLLDNPQIKNLARQISDLRKIGKQVIVVTSGAIGAGMAVLELKKRPNDIATLQACAAVGQGKLIETYTQAFKNENMTAAQILFTAEDLRSRHRFLNARNTILKLLERDVVPVINENDTVAVNEIKFGDNDRLSALTANLTQADLLIMLSDVSGFYDKNGQVINTISHISKDIDELCKGKGSALSTGGMKTKLLAAHIVMKAGIGMIIAGGRERDILARVMRGEDAGTFFEPHIDVMSSKKQWIAFFTKTHGSVILDKGAETAVASKGRSLLSSGITEIKGHFGAGDVINIVGFGGNEVGRGLSNYSSEELKKIKGLKTSEIEKILGYKTSDEVIHRDNMSIF